jgi:serine/threonine protein kinase
MVRYNDMAGNPEVQPEKKKEKEKEKEKDMIKIKIQEFIKENCDKKSEGLNHYLCEFDKTHNTSKNANAYLLNSEFFKDAKILGEGFFGAVYESGLWTIDSDSDTVQDIIVKTQKLDIDVNRPEPLFEAYINFVLINTIIMENPAIGLVPTFGLFYCGRKGDMFCANKDGTKIDENTDIFIVQEKKDAKSLIDVEKFTEEMMIQLFEILVKLEEKGIYHSDIHPGNILVDNKTGKIYLIDFGLASFMIEVDGVRKHQRIRNAKYFYNKNDCTAFDDFFAICAILSDFNYELFKIIYPLLVDIIKKFNNPEIKNISKIEGPFNNYLETTEHLHEFNIFKNSQESDRQNNLKIYNKYTMAEIYKLVKDLIKKRAGASKP